MPVRGHQPWILVTIITIQPLERSRPFVKVILPDAAAQSHEVWEAGGRAFPAEDDSAHAPCDLPRIEAAQCQYPLLGRLGAEFLEEWVTEAAQQPVPYCPRPFLIVR